MSPGTTRIRKKMSTATPSSVGIIRRSRFTMYLPMRSVPPLAERLLGEPHGVELLVQEVAGRDRPATHPRAVRDDAVPLERVEIVRFLVEKPLLELAHEPLALLRVARPTLPGVQLVEHAVGVAPVVVVAHARGLELVEVEIRLDHEPALGVHGHLEVDRKSTRLNSSHSQISYAVFCLKKKSFRNSRWQSPRPYA